MSGLGRHRLLGNASTDEVRDGADRAFTPMRMTLVSGEQGVSDSWGRTAGLGNDGV